MTIDWITVSAQIVNFLILVWLLKRFLYEPVIGAMDRRERRIAERLDEAREREASADEEAERYRREQEALERRRDQIIERARSEAEDERKALLEEGRDTAAQARKSWQEQAEREKDQFLSSLRRRSAEAIQAVARKVLTDLADADLEARIVEKFIDRLGALDEETRQALADGGDGTVRIASAFELEPGVRSRLTRAVHDNLAGELDVEYSRADDLICGIVLDHEGRRLSWNVADYLEDLTERVEAAFSGAPSADRQS